MPLEMKTECAQCRAPTPQNGVAYICSHECTYCAACLPASQRCPSCDGELQPRPRRGGLEGAPSVTQKRLAAFDDAWAQGDVSALAEFVTEDCVYSASVGPEPGTTYVGKADVVRGFREILAYEELISANGSPESGPGPQVAASENPVRIHGHRAFSQWSYPHVDKSGRGCWVRGCDFFEFDGRLIRRKDAFIKSEPMGPLGQTS